MLPSGEAWEYAPNGNAELPFGGSDALVLSSCVLLFRSVLCKLRPALRLGGARKEVPDSICLSPVPRTVVATRERSVWRGQSHPRIRTSFANWRVRSSEPPACVRLRARPHCVVTDDGALACAHLRGP